MIRPGSGSSAPGNGCCVIGSPAPSAPAALACRVPNAYGCASPLASRPVHMFHPFGSPVGPNAEYVTSVLRNAEISRTSSDSPDASGRAVSPPADDMVGPLAGAGGEGPGEVDRPARGIGARPPGPAWPARAWGAVSRTGHAPGFPRLALRADAASPITGHVSMYKRVHGCRREYDSRVSFG